MRIPSPLRPFILGVLVLATLALPLSAQLRLVRGAADYQVYQRKADNTADISLYGDAEGADGKQVEVRVLRANPLREERPWTPLGPVTGGRWTGVLNALPTGGPYSIEIRLSGTEGTPGSATVVRVTNILVGDLWVLAGQSNMEGVGDLENVQQPHALVNSFDMADTWASAEEPLHFLAYALDRVHWRIGRNPNQPERLPADRIDETIRNRTKGAGLGLPFAVELVKLTGVPIGLVPCAHGGTSMDQWDPAKKEMVGDSLYGSMIRRVKAVGGKVKGVLWYQGESDASDKAAPLYYDKFKNFIAAVRRDFDAPELPFYFAQIGQHVNPTGHDPWDVVQEAERRIELDVPHTALVSTMDAVLDDRIHVGTESLMVVGQRFARLACRDQFPDVAACQGFQRGPRPVRAERIGPRVIRLECSSVNGSLRADQKLWDFTVVRPGAEQQPEFFKAIVDPANPSALLIYFQDAPEGAPLELYYGKGRYGYANVVDEANMALPAFGPMKVQ